MRLATLLTVCCLPSAALAQAVVVKAKPGNGAWEVSYLTTYDKTDPGTGTHAAAMYCKTLAAAKAEAARLQRWDQQELAKPPVFFRLTKIYIEGEDTPAEQPPPKDAAPKTPGLLDQVLAVGEKAQAAKESYDNGKLREAAANGKEAYDKAKEIYDMAKETKENATWAAKFLADPKAALEEKIEGWEKKAEKDARKLGDTLKEYGDNVADAYKRAKALKEDMLKLDKDVMDKSFKKVNDAVAEYNKQAEAGGKFFDSKTSPFPKMKPVGPDTVKAADEWKAALKTQYDLEARKEKLDSQKAELDGERAKLAAEWKELSAKGDPDAADPKVARLRERLARYQEKTAAYSKDEVAYRASASDLQGKVNSFDPRAAARPEPPKVAAQPDPGTLGRFRGRVGETLYFEVVGRTAGAVWGSGVYSDDSTLAAAAVHAGVLRDGERGVVKVTILGGRSSYSGGVSNGVRSTPWQSWPGSYSVAAVGAK